MPKPTKIPNTKLAVQPLPQCGPNRTITVTRDGAPVLAGLALRRSTTRKGALKGVLAIDTGRGVRALPEFRLEMN